MVEARRADVVPVLASPPLQSDYVTRWKADAAKPAAPTSARRLSRAIYHRLPTRLQAFIAGWYQRGIYCTLRNRRAFRRL